MDKSKKVRMVVKLHRNKRFRPARVILGYGGAPYEELKKPKLRKADDGSELEFEVKRPQLGQEYRLGWASA